MSSQVASAIALAVGYLLGSVPTGLLVARARGVDITKVGSGNIGATNVARAVGKPLALLVLLVDAGKGFAPAWAAARWLPPFAERDWVVASVGLAAILGHVFPVWLKLHGGKGVATAFGVFLALAPVGAGAAFVVYALLAAVWRISSVGSLAAATSLVAITVATHRPTPTVALACAAWALIVVRHRANIRRLFRREEGRL